MKPSLLYQEVLVFTDTHFVFRELSNDDHLSIHDTIEKACWDGRLPKLLPELGKTSSITKENFLWQVIAAGNFLCVNTGLCHQQLQHGLCNNPCYFINTINYN